VVTNLRLIERQFHKIPFDINQVRRNFASKMTYTNGSTLTVSVGDDRSFKDSVTDQKRTAIEFVNELIQLHDGNIVLLNAFKCRRMTSNGVLFCVFWGVFVSLLLFIPTVQFIIVIKI